MTPSHDKDVPDVDFANVFTAIKTVAVASERSSGDDTGTDMAQAKKDLDEHMETLSQSPHLRLVGRCPNLKLSGSTKRALRAVWVLCDEMENQPEEVAAARFGELKAAVHRAVTCLDPTRTFPEDAPMEKDEAGKDKPRNSAQLADEEDEDNDDEDDEYDEWAELKELMGEDPESDDDEDEAEGDDDVYLAKGLRMTTACFWTRSIAKGSGSDCRKYSITGT